MTVQIKNFENIIPVDTIVPWIKSDVVIQSLRDFNAIRADDVVIVSKLDKELKKEDYYNYNILEYEECIPKFLLYIKKEFQQNYDYYFLSNALKTAKENNCETIITGSSYGLFGIDSTYLPCNCVNLSLASQDLYYSIRGIKDVMATNKNIQNIVICCGHYFPFSDLSRAQSEAELMRISKVYYRIWNDIHNSFLCPPSNTILPYSKIFDMKNATELYAISQLCKNDYFHKGRTREMYATKEWDDKTKSWIELSEEERIKAGERRAKAHNKIIYRKGTLKENIKLLREFCIYCLTNEVNLCFVVTPASKYYRDMINPEFKEIFYNILNDMPMKVKVLDLYDNDKLFTNFDFNDMDHLGDQGAKKLSEAINKII